MTKKEIFVKKKSWNMAKSTLQIKHNRHDNNYTQLKRNVEIFM